MKILSFDLFSFNLSKRHQNSFGFEYFKLILSTIFLCTFYFLIELVFLIPFSSDLDFP